MLNFNTLGHLSYTERPGLCQQPDKLFPHLGFESEVVQESRERARHDHSLIKSACGVWGAAGWRIYTAGRRCKKLLHLSTEVASTGLIISFFGRVGDGGEDPSSL